MASETVVSDHSAPSQEFEKQVQSEVKKMESENVSSVESTKPEESACPAAPSAESEAKIDEKQIEPPPVVEHVKDDMKADKKPKALDSVHAATPVAEPIEKKTEEVKKTQVAAPLAEPIEQKTEDEPVELPPKEEEKKTEDAPILEPSVEKAESKLEEKSETTEEKPEETANIVDASPAEIVEEKIEKEELPAKVVEEKPSEKSKVIEKVDKEPSEAEPVEKVEVKSPTLPKEEEISANESSDQVISENPATQVEEKDVECYLTDEVKEKNGEGKEPTKEAIEVKEKVAEPGKIDAKSEEKSVVTEELVQCEEKPTEDANISDPSPKLDEKVAEEAVTARDIKLVAENAKIEADKEATSKEPEKIEAAEKIKETVEKKVEEKIEETVEAIEAKLEGEKQVDEPAKTDVENPECTKEIEDTKKTQNVPAKTQKQSIVKMVKHSLVKAKKAIIGKSQNSKTPASDDGNK